jgi:hypothetical protein
MEMECLRRFKECIRLDKIKNEFMRKELNEGID